nr:zinc ribbon domain-containing protein [uncultured Methanobrevibacter sp.]
MSKYCPKCGNELPDEAKFCNECGYSVLVEDKKEDNLKTEESNESEVEVSETKNEENVESSMDLGDNIKKSLSYPLLDHNKFAMIGVLSVFSCLGTICAFLGLNNPIVILISFLVGILISIYLTGYNISIIKYGTYNKQFIPDFNIKTDILNFFKFYILTFVYGIIPSIIILITIFASGIIGAWTKLWPYIQQNSANIPPAII